MILTNMARRDRPTDTPFCKDADDADADDNDADDDDADADDDDDEDDNDDIEDSHDLFHLPIHHFVFNISVKLFFVCVRQKVDRGSTDAFSTIV